jgi:hypothetical protein
LRQQHGNHCNNRSDRFSDCSKSSTIGKKMLSLFLLRGNSTNDRNRTSKVLTAAQLATPAATQLVTAATQLVRQQKTCHNSNRQTLHQQRVDPANYFWADNWNTPICNVLTALRSYFRKKSRFESKVVKQIVQNEQERHPLEPQ